MKASPPVVPSAGRPTWNAVSHRGAESGPGGSEAALRPSKRAPPPRPAPLRRGLGLPPPFFNRGRAGGPWRRRPTRAQEAPRAGAPARGRRRAPAGARAAGEALAYRFRQPAHLGSAGFARGLDARALGAGAARFFSAALEAVSKDDALRRGTPRSALRARLR